MQPVLTQVPPNSLRSTSATFIPAVVSRPARDGPACPAPMMMASKDWVMAHVHDGCCVKDRSAALQQGGFRKPKLGPPGRGSCRQLLAGPLRDHVIGIPVRPVRIVLAAGPLLMLA